LENEMRARIFLAFCSFLSMTIEFVRWLASRPRGNVAIVHVVYERFPSLRRSGCA